MSEPPIGTMQTEQELSVGCKARADARGEVITMGKPSKAALSKAGSTLPSTSSSKSAKSKAGSTLGKSGQSLPPVMPRTTSGGAGTSWGPRWGIPFRSGGV